MDQCARTFPCRKRWAVPANQIPPRPNICSPPVMQPVLAAPSISWRSSKKKDATKARITADVSVGPRDGGGFGLAVKLHVEDASMPQSELAAPAKEAHEKICPYSHATRGNVDVQIDVKAFEGAPSIQQKNERWSNWLTSKQTCLIGLTSSLSSGY